MISEELHSQCEAGQTNRRKKDQKIQLETQWAEPVVHLSFCFEETLHRTFHKCILPNLIKSISQADVSLATFILLAGFGNLVLKFGKKRHDFSLGMGPIFGRK
jgi:hypothetical protein